MLSRFDREISHPLDGASAWRGVPDWKLGQHLMAQIIEGCAPARSEQSSGDMASLKSVVELHCDSFLLVGSSCAVRASCIILIFIAFSSADVLPEEIAKS